MLAEMVKHTIGIDPDRDWITASIVDTATTGELTSARFGTTSMGYAQLLQWINQHTSAERAWVVEGTGSYGAGVTNYLSEAGEWVIEFGHPHPTRDGAKTDALDARRAARQALGRSRLRVLETVRRGAQTARVAAINELKALVVTAPVDLRDQLRSLNTAALVTKTHKFRPGQPTSGSRSEHTATKMAMRSLARRIRTLTTEIAELKRPSPNVLPKRRRGHGWSRRAIWAITNASTWSVLVWVRPRRRTWAVNWGGTSRTSQTGSYSGHRGRATVGTGPFNRYPDGVLGLCPVDQLAVTVRGVSDVPILHGRAQVVHQIGREGILVRVDPDSEHGSSPIRLEAFFGSGRGSAKRIHASKQTPQKGGSRSRSCQATTPSGQPVGRHSLESRHSQKGMEQGNVEPSPPALPHPHLTNIGISMNAITAQTWNPARDGGPPGPDAATL